MIQQSCPPCEEIIIRMLVGCCDVILLNMPVRKYGTHLSSRASLNLRSTFEPSRQRATDDCPAEKLCQDRNQHSCKSMYNKKVKQDCKNISFSLLYSINCRTEIILLVRVRNIQMYKLDDN
ncbi:hypothetical protein PVAP13_2KG476610 [Panicum virgatum]|uniref:Uncharacterized protein n=1 Tax=Panicum virgatum TaxID=38727 RepID=A0A8T0WBW4_PANVG|nr:hypothetical protein PVAP13_2KG476610 [Panicum virgatum]